MGDEQFEGYDRISQVAGFFKTESYIDWCDRTDKRARNLAIKKAQKIGSEVDRIIKESLNTNNYLTIPEKAPEEVKSCIAGYSSWYKNYQPSSIVAGTRLYNHELKITGEPDAYLPRELTDFKCSLEIRPEYWLQEGGYLWLPLPIEVDKVSILRLGKTSSDYEYKCSVELVRLKTLFVSALNLYRYYKGEENGEQSYIS